MPYRASLCWLNFICSNQLGYGTARADGSAPFRHFQAKHPVNSALLLHFSSATLTTKLGTFRSILSAKNSFIKDSGGSQNTHNSKKLCYFCIGFQAIILRLTKLVVAHINSLAQGQHLFYIRVFLLQYLLKGQLSNISKGKNGHFKSKVREISLLKSDWEFC